MNIFNVERAFKIKSERGWPTLYVAVDAHGTIIKSYNDCIEFYPGSIEVLRWLTKREDFKVILWTSSYSKEITELLDFSYEKYGIVFDYVNQNPLEKNTNKANFSQKFYFNILLDDKAGFSPEDGDWFLIANEFEKVTGDKIINWEEYYVDGSNPIYTPIYKKHQI